MHLFGSAVPLAQLIDFETTCENSRRLRCLEVKMEVKSGDTIPLIIAPDQRLYSNVMMNLRNYNESILYLRFCFIVASCSRSERNEHQPSGDH